MMNSTSIRKFKLKNDGRNSWMNKVNFIKGIEYLNAYYVNFKVDIDNKMVQIVWYDALKHIDDDSFIKVITNYALTSKYAPQSPTDIINHYNQMVNDHVQGLVYSASGLIESTRYSKGNT